MDIAEKIEDAKQSDALLLIVFYTDWSPHYEWIEPLLHEFETAGQYYQSKYGGRPRKWPMPIT